MSESPIKGEDRDEKEAVFNRIWKKDDAFLRALPLAETSAESKTKKSQPAFYKPIEWMKKDEFTK